MPWLPEFKFRAGPKDKLDSTVISQPAIFVASLAALERLRQDEGEVIHWPCEHAKVQDCPVTQNCNIQVAMQEAVKAADVTCGLSLGEYTALTYAEAIRWVCILDFSCRTCQAS